MPIPTAVGLLAGAIALVSLCSAGRYLVRVVALTRQASAAVRGTSVTEGLVVVQDSSAYAYAVPGRDPRIVASSGMLAALSAPGRRFLLAHEQAHLVHRHHRYLQLSRLAAAANPLLRPVADAVDLAVERCADEDAAAVVGDRGLAARTIATAALAAAGTSAPPVALAVAHTNIADRVTGLLRPAPAGRCLAAAVVPVIALGCWIAGCLVIGHVHGLMELAEAAAAD